MVAYAGKNNYILRSVLDIAPIIIILHSNKNMFESSHLHIYLLSCGIQHEFVWIKFELQLKI